jgi:hypothetical protein
MRRKEERSTRKATMRTWAPQKVHSSASIS